MLAFPDYNISWLAWVGLVPLLVALYGRGAAYSFFISIICGIIFLTGLYSWIFDAPGFTILHHAISMIYLSPYLGLFGLAYSVITRRRGITFALLSAPFIWVCLEYLRSNLDFLALPFPILAHSQHQHLYIIQFVSITGAYGLSFLIVLANSALSAAILTIWSRLGRRTPSADRSPSSRFAISMILATLVLVAMTLYYGHAAVSTPLGGKTLKVSVLQGNIDRKRKADPRKYADFIMQKYAELTIRAAMDRPDLIVWPEAATPGLVLKNSSLLNQMVALVRRVNTHLLIGSSEYPKISDKTLKRKDVGNTALFFSPEGKVLGQYLKIRLIPFAEYVPHKDLIPWPRFILPENKSGFEIPGKEYTLFDLNGTKFGVVICSEGAFPDLFRKFVVKGADFMLNITNEGWFGQTALSQKVAASVFRAIEHRISLARATNTGISCFIDPYGRVIARIEKNGRDKLVDGYLTREIPLFGKRTVYTRHGEVLVLLSMFIAGLIVLLSLIRAKRQAYQSHLF